jgi:hypothetical protein
MSDDVGGAIVSMSTQVVQKSVETTGHLVDKSIDQIAKLLQVLFQPKQKNKAVKSTDMADIKSGVSISKI